MMMMHGRDLRHDHPPMYPNPTRNPFARSTPVLARLNGIFVPIPHPHILMEWAQTRLGKIPMFWHIRLIWHERFILLPFQRAPNICEGYTVEIVFHD